MKEIKLWPGVQTSTEISINRSGGSIHEYGGGQERSSLSVQLAQDGEQDDEEHHHGQLGPGPDQGGEEERAGGGPEHVPVDLLPSVLVTQVPLHVVHVVLLAVSGLVLPERPHLDHGH